VRVYRQKAQDETKVKSLNHEVTLEEIEDKILVRVVEELPERKDFVIRVLDKNFSHPVSFVS
jgi:hypothetical protein